MSEKTKNNSIFQLAKTLLLSSLITMLLLVFASFIAAVILKKVNAYENLYKAITIAAYCFIGFLSAKLTSRRYVHSLLPVFLLQTALNAFVLCATSALITKEIPPFEDVLFSFAIMFAASVLSLFFKRKRQRKNR